MARLAIETMNLAKNFGRTVAVAGIDLEVQEGCVFGFLGRNGAGKTTTIRMLLGLVRPSSGVARVLGNDVRVARGAVSRSVGAVVETPAFYGYLTARENLQVFGLSSRHRLSANELSTALDGVGLGADGDRRVHTFSLGMKQRLGIAAASLASPKVLFLDEPTNGLDPVGMIEMRLLIAKLSHDGRTVFVSSHDLSEVEQVCTHVAIIDRGVLKGQGPVDRLLSRQGLVVIITNDATASANVVRGLGLAVQGGGEDGRICVCAEKDDVPRIVVALVEAKLSVFEVAVRRASLEDVFLQVTGD